MADTKAKEATISVKVIVHKVNKKVVYVVADHSFVDILFSFMTLPMGTIVKLLGKHADTKFDPFGSLNNLYQSLKDFPECYLWYEEYKCWLLNPRCQLFDNCRNLKLKIDDTKPMEYLVCRHSSCSSDGRVMYYNAFCNYCASKECSKCQNLMGFIELSRDNDDCVGGGVFVSDIATFLITDDLHVEPYSLASSIELLADLGITDMNHLEERILEISSSQMVYFLNLALTTDCPFTYLVFSKINSIRSIVGSVQDNISDQPCDLMKKELGNSEMVLEVTRQKSTKKLLFAEAKEDFVDFLFGILLIPLGTVIGTLMEGDSSLTCMDNILKSISNMSVERYLKSQYIKDMLLEPHIGQSHYFKNQVFSLSVRSTPICEHFYECPFKFEIEGFLKQSGLFIVPDDLIIAPSSSFSTIDILKKLKVSPKDIERCEVNIGLEEGLRILKASLKSSLTLTKSLNYQMKK